MDPSGQPHSLGTPASSLGGRPGPKFHLPAPSKPNPDAGVTERGTQVDSLGGLPLLPGKVLVASHQPQAGGRALGICRKDLASRSVFWGSKHRGTR